MCPKDSINRLRIGHLTTAYHTNFLLMENNEFYKSMSVPVEWYMYDTGPEMIEAFLQEKLDVGYIGLTPAIIGIDKGVPLKCVAAGHMEGTNLIANPPFKPISYFIHNNNNVEDALKKTFEQLIGKTIGTTSPGSIHEVILNHYLHKFDLIEKVNVKHYSMAECIGLDLRNGLIDAGIATPALAVFSEYIGHTNLIIPPKYLWPHNPSYGIVAHENIRNNNPSILNEFLNEHKKATNLLHHNLEKASSLIANVFRFVDPPYIKRILKISPTYLIELKDEFVKATMQFAQRLYDLGYLSHPFSKEEIFEFKFV